MVLISWIIVLALFTWALCRAAALGDRAIDEARQWPHGRLYRRRVSDSPAPSYKVLPYHKKRAAVVALPDRR